MKGQIYFLYAVDLDDGPLLGHSGFWLCGLPQGRGPIGLHASTSVCAHSFSSCMCVHACMRERSGSWSPSALRSPALFHIRARWD